MTPPKRVTTVGATNRLRGSAARLLLPGILMLALCALSLWVDGDNCHAPTLGFGEATLMALDRQALEMDRGQHEQRVLLRKAASKPRPEEPKPATPPPTRPGIVRITGYCIDEHHRALPDCLVALDPVINPVSAGHRHPFADQRTTARSDAAGRFVVEFHPQRIQGPTRLTVSAPRRVTQSAEFPLAMARPWKDTDLGAVRLPIGCRVHGRLTDTSGRAQAKVSVVLNGVTFQSHRLKQSKKVSVVTDENGVFRADELIAPGNWELWLPHRAPLRSVRFTIRNKQTSCIVNAELVPKAAPNEVRGVVRDQSGNPKPRATIASPDGNVLSDRRGCFVIRRRAGCRETNTVLTLKEAGSRYGFICFATWGKDDIILTPWRDSGPSTLYAFPKPEDSTATQQNEAARTGRTPFYR